MPCKNHIGDMYSLCIISLGMQLIGDLRALKCSLLALFVSLHQNGMKPREFQDLIICLILFSIHYDLSCF